MSSRTLTPQELHALRSAGTAPELIDVRTPAEFRELHADIARSVPLDSLDPAPFVSASSGNGGATIYFICHSGNRSKLACERFERAGFRNVCSVEGGIRSWVAAGLPVVRGERAVSLERQVRIAAGSLVFGGSLLTALVDPYFIAIPAFVGAGLVFAGVTDRCGIALVLAKLPWNRRGGASERASCPS